MTTVVGALCTGLPFVPPAIPDELLGAWLLRVAEFYGVSWTNLVSRLNARQESTGALHWFALHGSTVELTSLATALRVLPGDLIAMVPPRCRPRWPPELGYCLRCMEQTRFTNQPVTWYRRWMHPLATACERHRVWLTPVAARTLRNVRFARDLVSLATQSDYAADSRQIGVAASVDDAVWLQQLCIQPAVVEPSWGKTFPWRLDRIVDAVAQLVMSGNVGDYMAKSFTIEQSADHHSHWFLPTGLRQRQWLLGTVGHILRHPVHARVWPASRPFDLAKRLVMSTSDWPAGAVEWICPQAAAFLRSDAELRKQHSISPAYFRARSALLSAFP